MASVVVADPLLSFAPQTWFQPQTSKFSKARTSSCIQCHQWNRACHVGRVAFLASLEGLIWLVCSRGLSEVLCGALAAAVGRPDSTATISGVRVPDSAALSKTFLQTISENLPKSNQENARRSIFNGQLSISWADSPQFGVLLLQMIQHHHSELLQCLDSAACVPSTDKRRWEVAIHWPIDLG